MSTDNSNLIEFKEVRMTAMPRVGVTVVFSCAFENRLLITAMSTGQVVFEANSHLNEFRQWHPTEPGYYAITGMHKDQPPGPGSDRKDWIPDALRVRNEDPEAGTRVIGFEDGSDYDFNDIVATIQH